MRQRPRISICLGKGEIITSVFEFNFIPILESGAFRSDLSYWGILPNFYSYAKTFHASETLISGSYESSPPENKFPVMVGVTVANGSNSGWKQEENRKMLMEPGNVSIETAE